MAGAVDAVELFGAGEGDKEDAGGGEGDFGERGGGRRRGELGSGHLGGLGWWQRVMGW